MFVFFFLLLSRTFQLLGTDLDTDEVFGDENALPPFVQALSRVIPEGSPHFPLAPLVDPFDAFKAAYTRSRLQDSERVLERKEEKREKRAVYENLKSLFGYLKNDNPTIQNSAFKELLDIAQNPSFPLIHRLDIALTLYFFELHKRSPSPPILDDLSSIIYISSTMEVYLFLYHKTLFFEDPFHFKNRFTLFQNTDSEVSPPPSIKPENFLLLLNDLHKTLETLY